MSKYTKAVERSLRGLEAVSTGLCPGCEECARDMGYEDMTEFAEDYESGNCEGEPHFSSHWCQICGSHLAGDREPWHAVVNGKVEHWDYACVDCVVYLANGDEPDGKEWKENASDERANS